MNILLTGKLDSIATSLIPAAGNNRIVLAANNIPPGELPNNVRPFNIAPTDTLFERVLKVGSFDAVVFFMARGEHTDKTEGGVTAFQSMLEHCEATGINQIVLVSSGEVFSGLNDSAAISETIEGIPKGAQGYQIKAAEDMSRQYWEHNRHTNVTVVRLPYIYQTKETASGDGLMAGLFKTVIEGTAKFELPGSPDTPCDFLSDTETARLIWLIIDEGIAAKFNYVNAGTGKSSTFGGIAALIGQHYPDIAIRYSGDISDVPTPMRTNVARSEYGWNVLRSLNDDFAEMKNAVAAVPVKRFPQLAKLARRVMKFFRGGSKGFIFVEFAVATVFLYALTNGLRSFTFATWIDLRFLFVVILSTLHGTISGIISGIIAGGMLFFSLENTDWRIIVYNPENWIPFALYVIIGVALGSKADRQRDNIESTEDKLNLAEQTNVYLVDLYDEAVHIKDKYRDQILGYKDNFGRIYTIVKKLNSEMSEYVFSSAIEVIEDVLENSTVAIYSISANGAYARMTVCSKSYYTEIVRSVRLHDYPQMMEKISQQDTWFNRDLIHGFPSYCAPVYNEDKLLALVMIWKADVDQMSLHYSNLFKILSGLIQESLVRAVKFYKLQESKMFFPDTRILTQEPFKAAYKANLALAEQEKAVFGLITVERSEEDLSVQSGAIESCIRESDVVGAINDETFGVILKNVSEDDIKFLLKRFKSRKLKAAESSIPQMQEYFKPGGDEPKGDVPEVKQEDAPEAEAAGDETKDGENEKKRAEKKPKQAAKKTRQNKKKEKARPDNDNSEKSQDEVVS